VQLKHLREFQERNAEAASRKLGSAEDPRSRSMLRPLRANPFA
jgi:hypothetical protein